MFGYQPGELIGENISIVNAPGEKSPVEVANEIQSILAEKGSWSGEVKNIKKCGEVFWCSASVSMIEHYQFGSVWISLHQDITKAKEAELALKENEAMLRDLNTTKDKFFSIIAHDLKSPFNAIIGFSDLLKEQVKQNDYEGIEEFAEIIQNSATRAMELLENLLEWSRIQTGRMRFNPEKIDLVAQIQETTYLLHDAALQKGIGIAMDLPEHLYLMVDARMLSSILRNLLTNAIKFTRVCGRIVIEVRQLPNEVLVVVKDNGVGISKEMIQKLFRLDETFSTVGTNKEKGTGLGLKLVKEFIEKHGGHLKVESTPGEGSTFSFTLPT
jgi:PAS domain S-box-containing protein